MKSREDILKMTKEELKDYIDSESPMVREQTLEILREEAASFLMRGYAILEVAKYLTQKPMPEPEPEESPVFLVIEGVKDV